MIDGPVVLLIADGASEPVHGRGQTSLERARTPAVDALLHTGVLQRAATIPDGMAPGTEVGIPTLLGAPPHRPPSRGMSEALAAGIDVPPGHGVWRLDLVPPATPSAEQLAALAARLGRLGATVHHIGRHRCLLVGPAEWGDAPPGPHHSHGRLAALDAGAFDDVVALANDVLAPASVWPWGRLHVGDAPHAPQADRTRVVTQGGAVAGIAALLGCTVECASAGAAGDIVAGAKGGEVIIVHDPRPDDAAHARDPSGKVAALEAFDREVVAPVAAALAKRGGRLIVATDHGCDPRTGRHDAEPVPVVLWAPGDGPGGSRPRWTERDAARLGVVPAEILLGEQLRMAAA